jgi:hypothetical protein
VPELALPDRLTARPMTPDDMPAVATLLGWQPARGVRVHAERHPEAPARLTVAVCTSISAAEALVRHAGLVPRRWYSSFVRDPLPLG